LVRLVQLTADNANDLELPIQWIELETDFLLFRS